jgi:hypothetical protein
VREKEDGDTNQSPVNPKGKNKTKQQQQKQYRQTERASEPGTLA